MNYSKIYSKTLRNIIVAFIIGLFTAILGYTLRIYIARTYTVEEYGLVYSIIAFLSFFIIFVDLGLSQAVFKKIVELKSKNKLQKIKNTFFTVLIFQLILTSLVSLILFFSSNLMSKNFFHTNSNIFFNIMLIWFFSLPLNFIINIHMFSYQKTTLYTLSDLIKIIIILLISVLLSYVGAGILSVMIGYALVNFILFFIYIIYNRNFIKGRMNCDFYLIYPEALKYGLFVAVSSFSWLIITQSDTLVINYFLGLKYSGLYQAAIPIASVLTLIITPISTVFLSSTANLWANKKKKELTELTSLIYTYIWVLVLPILLTITLYSKTILLLLFGDTYTESSAVLSILVFSFMFLSLSILLNQVLSVLGEAKNAAKAVIFISILNIIGNILLVNLYGMIGVAISTLISCGLLFILFMKLLSRKITIKIDYEKIIKTIFSSILFLLTIIIMKKILDLNPYLEATICIVVAGSIYIITLIMQGMINLKKIMSFKK